MDSNRSRNSPVMYIIAPMKVRMPRTNSHKVSPIRPNRTGIEKFTIISMQ